MSAIPSNDATSVVIRTYSAQDEAGVLALHNLVFATNLSAEYLRWKLLSFQLPFPHIWVAEDRGLIVGFFPGLPVRMWHMQAELSAMTGVDFMVHPDYRGQGIAVGMKRAAFEVWKREGVALQLALPNQQWGELGNFQKLFELRWMSRPVRLETLVARRFGMHWGTRPQPVSGLWRRFWRRRWGAEPQPLREIKASEEGIDQLWERARPHLDTTIVRDARWLQWRYFEVPASDYKILVSGHETSPDGYVVLRIARSGASTIGYLVEAFWDPTRPEYADVLLASAIDYLECHEVDHIATLAPEDTHIQALFKRAGFYISWGAFDVRLSPAQTDICVDNFRDPQRWLMWGGDFDVL